MRSSALVVNEISSPDFNLRRSLVPQGTFCLGNATRGVD